MKLKKSYLSVCLTQVGEKSHWRSLFGGGSSEEENPASILSHGVKLAAQAVRCVDVLEETPRAAIYKRA